MEIAQIVKEPKPTDVEKQKVIDQLNTIREDVLDNDTSFNVKAILYSEDPGSKSKGGFYSITKDTGFDKKFKDVAFSLKEGEISEPFETPFGYHIIYIEKNKLRRQKNLLFLVWHKRLALIQKPPLIRHLGV